MITIIKYRRLYLAKAPYDLVFRIIGPALFLSTLRVLHTHPTKRKDCFQNKSKFITEDQFTKHKNITA